jgi:predicted PurR-regulated permease PerM
MAGDSDIIISRKQLWRIAIVVAVAAVSIGLLYLLRNALIPVFVSLLLAYLMDPVVGKLQSKYINRSFAIVILAVLLVVTLWVAGTLIVVQTEKEIVDLSKDFPQYLQRAEEKIEPLAQQYLGIETPKNIDEMMSQVGTYVSKLDVSALKPVTDFIGKATSKTLHYLGLLFELIIIPVFLFYFLRDWQDLKNKVKGYIPFAYRDYLVAKFVQIDEVLGAFIRGQLTVCLLLGLMYSVGLWIVGTDLALVIGITSGLAFIVPYMGTILGIVAGTILTLLEFGLSWRILGVFAVFGVAHAIEGGILTPRILGNKVGLSPVVVIIALLVGADLLGFLGILIAVPAAAVLNVFIKDGLERYRKSSFFLEPAKNNPEK